MNLRPNYLTSKDVEKYLIQPVVIEIDDGDANGTPRSRRSTLAKDKRAVTFDPKDLNNEIAKEVDNYSYYQRKIKNQVEGSTISLLETYTDDRNLLKDQTLKRSFAKHLDTLMQPPDSVESTPRLADPLAKLIKPMRRVPLAGFGIKSMSPRGGVDYQRNKSFVSVASRQSTMTQKQQEASDI